MSDGVEKTEVKQKRVSTVSLTLGALTLLFSWSKIMGHIDWSWWLVLAPLWGPMALAAGILVVVGIALVVALVGSWIGDTLADRSLRKRTVRPKTTLNPNKR